MLLAIPPADFAAQEHDGRQLSALLAAVRIDLVGTTADFRAFGPLRSLPINHLLCENRRTAGRTGEAGISLPAVARSAIAHEIGHAIAPSHNGDATALMCARPASCRPDAFASPAEHYFPLTPGGDNAAAEPLPRRLAGAVSPAINPLTHCGPLIAKGVTGPKQIGGSS
jgi:hypothetical protein